MYVNNEHWEKICNFTVRIKICNISLNIANVVVIEILSQNKI